MVTTLGRNYVTSSRRIEPSWRAIREGLIMSPILESPGRRGQEPRVVPVYSSRAIQYKHTGEIKTCVRVCIYALKKHVYTRITVCIIYVRNTHPACALFLK